MNWFPLAFLASSVAVTVARFLVVPRVNACYRGLVRVLMLTAAVLLLALVPFSFWWIINTL